jgi:hypothetical protein
MHLQPTQQQTQPGYEDEKLDEEQEAGFHIASVIKRYNGIPMPSGMLYRQGNKQVYIHHGPPPALRASRNQSRTTEEAQMPMKRRRFHWAFWIGPVLLMMIIGYVALSGFGSCWQIHGDDNTYGRPRTFQIDAVVGHDDSQEHPSHFIAINLNRRVLVIEIPEGDVSKSVIYSGPTFLGDGQDLTPVTLIISDINGDGKPNMLVHILDQTIVFLNNGTKFVPPSNTVINGESNLPIRGEA